MSERKQSHDTADGTASPARASGKGTKRSADSAGLDKAKDESSSSTLAAPSPQKKAAGDKKASTKFQPGYWRVVSHEFKGKPSIAPHLHSKVYKDGDDAKAVWGSVIKHGEFPIRLDAVHKDMLKVATTKDEEQDEEQEPDAKAVEQERWTKIRAAIMEKMKEAKDERDQETAEAYLRDVTSTLLVHAARVHCKSAADPAPQCVWRLCSAVDKDRYQPFVVFDKAAQLLRELSDLEVAKILKIKAPTKKEWEAHDKCFNRKEDGTPSFENEALFFKRGNLDRWTQTTREFDASKITVKKKKPKAAATATTDEDGDAEMNASADEDGGTGGAGAGEDAGDRKEEKKPSKSKAKAASKPKEKKGDDEDASSSSSAANGKPARKRAKKDKAATKGDTNGAVVRKKKDKHEDAEEDVEMSSSEEDTNKALQFLAKRLSDEILMMQRARAYLVNSLHS